MLEQAQATATVIFSTRRGELSEIIASAAGGGASPSSAAGGASGAGGGGGARGTDASRVGSLDVLDGIVVIGGDGTFFEVCAPPRNMRLASCFHIFFPGIRVEDSPPPPPPPCRDGKRAAARLSPDRHTWLE